MTSFTFQALCPKCGKPLLMGTGKTVSGAIITEYRCRNVRRMRVGDRHSIVVTQHCTFNRVIISNEHMVSMKRRTTLSWDSLVAVYDKDYNVPVNRGEWNVTT